MIRRPLRTAAVPLMLAGLLAACSSMPWSSPKVQQPLAVPRGSLLTVPSGTLERAPPAPRMRHEARARSHTRTAHAMSSRAGGDQFAPVPRLVGLSESETVALLGPPAAQADQAPGKVWTYKTQGCALDVHLFPDMGGGGFYALDYTAEGTGTRDACLRRVAEAHRKSQGAKSLGG